MSLKKQDNSYDVKAGLELVQDFSVTGLSAVIDNSGGAASEQINFLWESFFEKQIALKVPGRKNDVIYAVYSDYEGDHTKPYRLTIGYITNTNEAVEGSGLHAVKVRGGSYAALSARGAQPQSLIETWIAVWESDLERNFCTDFEVYGARFFEEGVSEVLVYVGLKEGVA